MIRLLAVDDSALMRKLIGQIFSSEPEFEVQFARDGVEAIAKLHAYKPDVITLDVHMPQMDGLKCLNRIMVERPAPVVMVSSVTEQGAQETLEALRLGAVDFVAKPSGAISLQMEEWAPNLVTKVRGAATAKLRSTLRLKERIQRRIADAPLMQEAPVARRKNAVSHARAIGAGVVLVGTSTGGPPALETLLTSLPGGFPWPILIAQHMPATFTGPLARRLNGLTAIEVVEVAEPTLIAPGTAYIGRGDADIVLSRRGDELIALSVPPLAGYPWQPSADRLVRSAMAHLPAAQLIGVLMTGMGHDGAAAMTLLRSEGGATIAESRETAVVWGMPGQLVAADGASFIEPVDRIAERLQALAPTCL